MPTLGGAVGQSVDDLEHAVRLLNEAARTPLPGVPDTVPETDDPVRLLETARQQFRLDYQQSRARLTDLKQSLAERGDFNAAARDQRERLASLTLLRGRDDAVHDSQCPVCGNAVTEVNDVVSALRADLEQLDANVVFVNDDTLEIQALIAQEEETLRAVRQALDTNRVERDGCGWSNGSAAVARVSVAVALDQWSTRSVHCGCDILSTLDFLAPLSSRLNESQRV